MVDLDMSYDIILGDDWACRLNCIACYQSKTLQVWKGKRCFALKPCDAGTISADTAVKSYSMLSALQAGRAMRKGCKSMLLVVTRVNDGLGCQVSEMGGANSDCLHGLDSMIQEYSDVFADKLPGDFLLPSFIFFGLFNLAFPSFPYRRKNRVKI